jgi:hypothetical protein
LLDIPDIVEEIREEDDVEGTGGRQGVPVRQDEVKARVLVTGREEHLGGEIDPETEGGLKGGQQVSFGAADLEDAEPSSRELPQDALETAVVVGAPAPAHA